MLHFVEVKAWSDAGPDFHPLTAFSGEKQRRLRRAALAFAGEMARVGAPRPDPGDAFEAEHYLRVLSRFELDLQRLQTDLNWSFDLVWAHPDESRAATDRTQETYSCEYFPSLF